MSRDEPDCCILTDSEDDSDLEDSKDHQDPVVHCHIASSPSLPAIHGFGPGPKFEVKEELEEQAREADIELQEVGEKKQISGDEPDCCTLTDSEDEFDLKDSKDHKDPVVRCHITPSHSFPAIYGFGPGPKFEVKEELEERAREADVELQEVSEKNKLGRPKGKKGPRRTGEQLLTPSQGNFDLKKRHYPAQKPCTPSPRKAAPTVKKTPQVKTPASTSTRTTFFLVGKPPISFGFSKLPKAKDVLGRHLIYMESKSLTEASKSTTEDIKAVWLHHFGPQLIKGIQLSGEKGEVEEIKMIQPDKNIERQVTALYKRWRGVEYDSRRPERASKSAFRAKQDKLVTDLNMPFNVAKVNAPHIIQKSVITEWKEEVQYPELHKVQNCLVAEFFSTKMALKSA